MKFESFEFDGLWEYPNVKYSILYSFFSFQTDCFSTDFLIWSYEQKNFSISFQLCQSLTIYYRAEPWIKILYKSHT